MDISICVFEIPTLYPSQFHETIWAGVVFDGVALKPLQPR